MSDKVTENRGALSFRKEVHALSDDGSTVLQSPQ